MVSLPVPDMSPTLVVQGLGVLSCHTYDEKWKLIDGWLVGTAWHRYKIQGNNDERVLEN
jgi:hypothetical protein